MNRFELVELDLFGVLVGCRVEVVHLLAHFLSLRARLHLVGKPHLVLALANRFVLMIPVDFH